MNAMLEALNNEIEKTEQEIKQRESKLQQLWGRRNDEARIEQKKLIALFNKSIYRKLEMINKRLPKEHVVSGFESDTYLGSKMKIVISSGQYSFDFVIKEGDIVYENKRSNDGVGTNSAKEIIKIINDVLENNL